MDKKTDSKQAFFVSTGFALLLLAMPFIVWSGVFFDRTDDKLDCGQWDVTNWAGITISAWVYYGDAGSAEHSVFSNYGGTSTASVLLRIEPASERVEWFIITEPNSQKNVNATSTSVPVNEWAHILVRYNKTDMAIYVNGTKDASTTSATANLDANIETNILNIGTTPHTGSDPYGGRITEVAVWDVGLTDAEISILANSRMKRMPLQIDPGNLMHYWPLDDEEDGSSGDGDTFEDIVGGQDCTGNDGANNINLTMFAEQVLSYPR